MSTNPELRDRETRGVNNSSRRYILSEETLNAFRDRAKHEFPANQPDILFTAIDPSGGGSGSDFVILTIALLAGAQVVVSCYKAAHARASSPRRGRTSSASDRS